MSCRMTFIIGAAMMAAPVLALSAGPEWADQVRFGHRTFGKDAPFRLPELPASPLRQWLESLPAAARERALRWLHEFSFPAADLQSLRVDRQGAILYVDEHLPEGEPEPTTAMDGEDPEIAEGAADDAFILHSRPGAPNQARARTLRS